MSGIEKKIGQSREVSPSRDLHIFGLRFDNITLGETIARIDEFIAAGKSALVVTPNVDHLVKCARNPDMMSIFRDAEIVIVDGVPVVWGAKLLGKPFKEKVSGSDLFPAYCEHAAQTGRRIFLLGAAEGVAEQAAEELRRRFGDINFVGCYSPPYGFERDEEENARIIDMINEAEADVVFAAFGAPKQEKWFAANREALRPLVAIGCGASFDFIAGNLKRAPRWMQKCGLEWLHRLASEPRRLAKRYLWDDIYFLVLLFKEWRKK